MRNIFSYIIVLFCFCSTLKAQHDIAINAKLVPEENAVYITQEIVFKNNTQIALSEIYLNDWANSFASKTTPLAKRFAENYNSSIHFEKNKERGNTNIKSVVTENASEIKWERSESLDIVKLILNKNLFPNEELLLKIEYVVTLPKAKFTRYGAAKNGDFKLKYWYLSPAVFDGEWHAYSNKNTDDLYLQPSNFLIDFTYPSNFTLTSEFDILEEKQLPYTNSTKLKGENRMRAIIHLEKYNTFNTVETDKLKIVTNLLDEKVARTSKALLIDRIVHFLDTKLGPYPFDKLLISESDYKSRPVYGLNQLPNFISPFPDGFEYDMEQLKTITRNYIENTVAINPREDYWLQGAMQIYLMMQYVNTYYPNMKIIGNLSDFWIVRWSHASDLEFNDQYPLLYMNMARNNLHQSLTTPKDSLVKFNKNIAADYYAGDGFTYLSDYLGEETLNKSIKEFYLENKLKPVSSEVFENKLEANTELPVNWFFDEYVGKRTTIDFKIKKVRRKGDSLEVTIKNKKDNIMPVSLYGLDRDTVVFKQWTMPIDSLTSVTIPAQGIRKLALNYEASIPEINQRNNYKNLNGILNRPIQFRLFQDVEDPQYNQLFFMPIFEYNLYDGITAGVKLYNKTFISKGLSYKLEPQFGFRSKTIIGSGSISYTQNFDEKSLYAIRYGISGNRYSYNEDLFYRRISPFLTFAFRNEDLRDNEKQFLNVRSITVSRDDNPNDPNQDPDYSVFNMQYVYSNPNLINYFRGEVDYELSSKFAKISTTFEYRKLLLNNRQLNIRAFAGAFIFNDTREDEDFFSFALDRPTDYLFNYNYYGRSEDTGLFSQQLIVAEGGFKSQLEPAFANSFITTLNASTNIWKWVYAYGDVGLIHNKGEALKGVFDSGIRVSLVADYFELYFPLYSSLGWEPGLPNYEERIRFIVTLSPSTLLRLFTREWY